jgi:hypothetical protein
MLAWLKAKVATAPTEPAPGPDRKETVLERVKFRIRTGVMAGPGGSLDWGI